MVNTVHHKSIGGSKVAADLCTFDMILLNILMAVSRTAITHTHNKKAEGKFPFISQIKCALFWVMH